MIVVPAVPLSASSALSSEEMIALLFPAPVRKLIALSILGPMLPAGNWPSSRYLLYVCQNQQGLHSDDLGEEGCGSILVQDCFNASQHAVFVSDDWNPSTTST